MQLDFDLERDELAKRLGGGLPQGSLCLIEGSSGSGKSVVAQRLAYGLLANGHDAVYASTEFTTPAFIDQMDQLGYPIMDAFTEHRFRFVSTNPLVGHPVPKEQRLSRLLAARGLLTATAVVVDVFSHLAHPHLEGSNGGAVLEQLVRTLKQVNATGTTLLLTLDPGHLEGLDTAPLTGAADVCLECTAERKGGQVDRILVPRKFARATGSVGDVIPFRVEQGAGFIVEIKAVS